jgi:UDP-N-acetylmuramoyl-tripeptide--D-alanyl-D-alanine ligase
MRSHFKKPVIGITGSCGKTSTKEMLRLLLGEGATHATAGNWNNRIGVPMTLFDLNPSQHKYAVIEAGINQPGEMALLGEMIQADLTILTNIGPAHLELLGSLEGIAEEKSKLAERSRKNAPIVLPMEALQYPAYAKMKERCIAVQFNEIDEIKSEAGELVTCRIEPSQEGRASKVMIDDQEYLVASSSEGIARNAALAIVAALRLGGAAEVLAERIRQWQPERTRGRVVSRADHFYYIDCYNANPASMIDALRAFQKSAPAGMPRCYVLGAMNELGDAAEQFHDSVARQLKLRSQDVAVFVGPKEMTSAYQHGAEASGAVVGQINCAENIESIESMVADFEGALFLKGSRSYHLENLLPDSV